MKYKSHATAAFFALLIALGITSAVLEKRAAVAAAGVEAPQFEVDPLWPKPLPNHWVIGSAVGVSVDSQDHIWIVHRTTSFERMELYAAEKPPAAECCIPAPPVLEFDEEGNLIGHWGGPGAGYDWPDSNHGITVDYKGNVWIGGNSRGPDPKGYHDNMVLKFTQSGKFLMQIGHPNKSQGSNDTENLKGPAKLFVDKASDELYVADGYGNHRVIVYDAETGKYKRHWGAYGKKPDDTNLGPYNPDAPPAQQFAIRCPSPSFRTRACSMFATARTTASRCSRKTAPSLKRPSSPQKLWVTGQSGTSPSPRILSRNTFFWPTVRMKKFTSCSATRLKS